MTTAWRPSKGIHRGFCLFELARDSSGTSKFVPPKMELLFHLAQSQLTTHLTLFRLGQHLCWVHQSFLLYHPLRIGISATKHQDQFVVSVGFETQKHRVRYRSKTRCHPYCFGNVDFLWYVNPTCFECFKLSFFHQICLGLHQYSGHILSLKD